MSEDSMTEVIAIVVRKLDASDIVWTRYGSQTKEELAESIIGALIQHGVIR